MVQKIVRDVLFLGQTSVIAQPEDIKVGLDLQDTLRANSDRCVGMAANMIGVRKRIIIVNMGIMNILTQAGKRGGRNTVAGPHRLYSMR